MGKRRILKSSFLNIFRIFVGAVFFLFSSCDLTESIEPVQLALLSPKSISTVRAVISSQLQEDGNQILKERGYLLKNLDDLNAPEVRVLDLRLYGEIQHKLFDLKPGQNYSVKSFVITEKVEYFSNEIIFQTKQISPFEYSIGEKGPGGGLIFLDWGDYSRGYRYMEARSLEADFYNNFVWSPLEFKIIGTSREVGAGELNTDIYLQKTLNTNSLNGFYSVSVFEKNGFRDWFIPSVEELKLVFDNLLRDQVLKEFIRINSDRYLSSTEVDRDKVYMVNGDNQTESVTFKGIGHNVLAVRVF